MVKSFQFTPTPTIVFGLGKRRELPDLIRRFGNRVLIITGSGSFGKSQLGSELLKNVRNSFETCYFESISGEPTTEAVDSVVAKFDKIPLDVIVAIGGGSVLDAGKAISAMMHKNESVINFLEGVGIKQPNGIKIPFIALPTTAGTGSEATKNAVISKIGRNGFKKSLRHDNYIPNIALVDPELTISCSRDTTAASGLDAVTQLLEAYVSTKSSALNDALAFDGLKMALPALQKAWENGTDLEARSAMSYAALLSGITLAIAGLGTVHGFASSIGGLYPIPHGVVCGTLMAECAALNIKKLTATKPEAFYKYATIGKLLSGNTGKPEEYYLDLLIDKLRELTEIMKIPKLSVFGVEKNDFEQIITLTENKNNPVDLIREDLLYLLEKRF